MSSQSKSPGLICDAAVEPRSDTPNAPRTPKPRSVKFNPFRTVFPMPSYGIQLINEASTPPCSIKSSSNLPISLSANAVMIPVRNPKHRLKPRATLYSPPPSHTSNLRAVRTRACSGSSRNMISPSEIRSYLHESDSFIFKTDISGNCQSAREVS